MAKGFVMGIQFELYSKMIYFSGWPAMPIRWLNVCRALKRRATLYVEPFNQFSPFTIPYT